MNRFRQISLIAAFVGASLGLFPNLGMGIDLSTNKGKGVLSVATAAFLAGKKVSVFGTGTCFGTTNSLEIIDSITVYP
jgi:hypothetical protein